MPKNDSYDFRNQTFFNVWDSNLLLCLKLCNILFCINFLCQPLSINQYILSIFINSKIYWIFCPNWLLKPKKSHTVPQKNQCVAQLTTTTIKMIFICKGRNFMYAHKIFLKVEKYSDIKMHSQVESGAQIFL